LVRFPVKGVGGLSLIFSRVFVAVDFLAIVLFVGFVVCFKVSVLVLSLGIEVSSVSSNQGFVVSEYHGIRVSGCAVEILARSLVRQHFC
jgi:hypothetical protein